MDLSGLIDVDQEIARLTKEVERLTPLVDSYKRKIGASDYATKVPENVQKVNTDKLAGYMSELEATFAAMSTFESMK